MSGEQAERMLRWVRPRRWSITFEAAFAALLALLAWPVVALDGESDEVELVIDYLEALRDGDVEKAQTYIKPGQAVDADDSWLNEESLSSRWEIESVRHRSASNRYVHAVIASGGESVESSFLVEESGDGLRIANPYMYLTVGPGPIQALNLNGSWHTPHRDEEDVPVQVALFPGSYRLFEDVPGFPGGSAASFLAMPQDRPVALAGIVGEAFAGNGELETRLNNDLIAWIDSCVRSTEAQPEGCPFSAVSEYGGVDDGVHEFKEAEDLAWAVDAYPRVRIDDGLELETLATGWVSLSGEGDVMFEGTEERVRGRCRVGFGTTTVLMLPGGQFAFTAEEGLSNTCRRGLS